MKESNPIEIKVITLCGSARFKQAFREMEMKLTKLGYAVFSLGFFEKSEGIEITPEEAQLFGEIHLKKIDLADEIFVIDVDGYIGESTQQEIDYAKAQNKIIYYYSKISRG